MTNWQKADASKELVREMEQDGGKLDREKGIGRRGWGSGRVWGKRGACTGCTEATQQAMCTD